MNVLVTGAAGFIGSHLSERLLECGHTVLGLDNLVTGRIENLKSFIDHKNFTFLEKDITDKQSLLTITQPLNWIFHLAGLADIVPSIEQPDNYFNTNVQGTLNVLSIAVTKKVSKFVYAASSSSYGLAKQIPTTEIADIDPQYPYALTKYMGEELVMHWGKVYQLPVVSLRMFNVYGLRSRTSGAYGAVFGVFLAQKLKNKPFTVVGDGTQSRDFTYVSDVVEAFISAADSKIEAEVFNIGSGDHYSINYLVELLGGGKVHIPKRPGEPQITFADTTKIEQKLGWKAKVSIEEGVSIMLENIDNWRDSPLWDDESISKATETWFEHLTD